MASVEPPTVATRATANPGAAETASSQTAFNLSGSSQNAPSSQPPSQPPSQYPDFKSQTWYDVQRNAPTSERGAASAEGVAAAASFSPEELLRQAEQQTAERKRGARLRAAPPVYFIPRRSWGVSIARYGAVIAAGLGAGMALETWIRQKVAEDGGYVLGKGKPRRL